MKRSPVPWFVRKSATSLRKKLPAQHPVIVRCGVTDPLHAADCQLVRNRFIITIDPNSMGSDREWVETLAHEWAHALTWKLPSQQDHDASWGVQYARCYCVVFGCR